MTLFVPLWADGEWIKLIVPIVMFTVWVLNRLFGSESPAAKQQKARQQARANPPPRPADKQRVEDEVGEFLRRAAQQRAAKDGRSGPVAPPQPPKQARRPLSAGAPARSSSSGARTVAEPTVEPTRQFPNIAGESVASRTITDRNVQGTEVAQAVEAMQSHVEQAFSRHVGTLVGGSRATPASTAPTEPESEPGQAAELAAMLRDPRSIREAIVISEILRRPEERW